MKPLTAGELLRLLADMPPEAEVFMEGCDCYTRPAKVVLSTTELSGHRITLESVHSEDYE